MSNSYFERKSSRLDYQQPVKSTKTFLKRFSIGSVAIPRTQEDLLDTTRDQITKSEDVLDNAVKPHSAGSNPSNAATTVTYGRQTRPEDTVKARHGTDATTVPPLPAKSSTAKREREGPVEQPQDSSAATEHPARQSSSALEGKREGGAEHGSAINTHRRGTHSESQRQNRRSALPATISGPSTAHRQAETLTREGIREDSKNNLHPTITVPTNEVPTQGDTFTREGERKDLKNDLHPTITVPTNEVPTQGDTFTREGERKDLKNDLHAITIESLDKASAQADTSSHKKQKNVEKHESALHTTVSGNPTEASMQEDTPPLGEGGKGKRELALHAPPFEFSTEVFMHAGASTPDRKWEDTSNDQFTSEPLTQASMQADTSTPDGGSTSTTATELFMHVNTPTLDEDLRKHDSASDSETPDPTQKPASSAPTRQGSFISGRKSKNAFRNFIFKRQEKIPSELALAKQKIAKPGRSATTRVSLAVEDLSEDQVIIAVMGPTGSGKSSFIGAATGSDVGVGHELQSCTTEINMVKLDFVDSFERTDFDIVFVDTPGFDDTNKTDVEILEMLADWLNKTYQSKITLAGILYFHRISDNRMAGTPLKNLRMFKELCGKKALENIILVTTMWDEVEEDVGSQREKELRGKYWKAMIDQGSATARYHGTMESAWGIVEHFTTQRQAVLLQKEMVDLQKQLPETTAGRELYTTLEVLVKRQQDILQKIRTETKRHENEQDQRILNALKAEYEIIRQQLNITMNEMQTLKLPLGKRLIRLLWSPIGLTVKTR